METPSYQGKIIKNTWRLARKIGEGGFGSVHEARHLELDRRFAIKVLHRHLTNSGTFLQRFKIEATTTAKLDHPNIVAVTDSGEDDELGYYFVMEYLEGEPLDSRISRQGKLDELTAVRIVREVARGLSYAHQMGIIHRDIKSPNIFLCKGPHPDLPRVKILDFGIAKLKSSLRGLTVEGSVIGSPDYMAPEQFQGVEPDARTDLYALGVVFYEMVAGQLPFQGQTPLEILAKKATCDAPRPIELDPGLRISPEVELAILTCLRRSKENRFRSADEFILRLDEIERSLVKGHPETIDLRGATEALKQKMIDDESLIAIDTREYLHPEDVVRGPDVRVRPPAPPPAPKPTVLAGEQETRRGPGAATQAVDVLATQGRRRLAWVVTLLVVLLVLAGGTLAYFMMRAPDEATTTLPSPAPEGAAGPPSQAAMPPPTRVMAPTQAPPTVPVERASAPPPTDVAPAKGSTSPASVAAPAGTLAPRAATKRPAPTKNGRAKPACKPGATDDCSPVLDNVLEKY